MSDTLRHPPRLEKPVVIGVDGFARPGTLVASTQVVDAPSSEEAVSDSASGPPLRGAPRPTALVS